VSTRKPIGIKVKGEKTYNKKIVMKRPRVRLRKPQSPRKAQSKRKGQGSPAKMTGEKKQDDPGLGAQLTRGQEQ